MPADRLRDEIHKSAGHQLTGRDVDSQHQIPAQAGSAPVREFFARRTQHPPVQFACEIDRFVDRDERIGWQQPARRVLPPDQGLDSDDRAGPQVDLG